MWNWVWPTVGSAPISQNTDSEMFDRTDYPYTETFVREAIQNTLDARLDAAAPATIRFRFHRSKNGPILPYIKGALGLRREAELRIPEEWHAGEVDWLTIEDFNTKGLDGDLEDRFSNFWNYWLNFGLSNKDGHGRGGRGIGRVTFLIASRIQTVVGLTRRNSDGLTAACGMTVLRAMRAQGAIRSTHAYLAVSENKPESIFNLHEGLSFHDGLASAFGLAGYHAPPHRTGLALAIPYPHTELKVSGILASAIEHFAPAILNESLSVQVDDKILDRNSIDAIAAEVANEIHTTWIKEDVSRYLTLLRCGLAGPAVDLQASIGEGLVALRASTEVEKLQKTVEVGEVVVCDLKFNLKRSGSNRSVSIRAVASRTPEGLHPVDRLFREGMSLPDVKAASAGEIDLLLLVEDIELATYLNFCEGKAHLDLLESKEIRTKLEEKGYQKPLVAVKRFVKGLPVEFRKLLTPEIIEPELDVFDAFFSLPDPDPGKRKGPGGKPVVNPQPPPPPPPPRISAIRVRPLADGFRIEANPEFTGWPVNVSVTMAYADGSRSPAWSTFDFDPEKDLETSGTECDFSYSKNKLVARNCQAGCEIKVIGFDTRREVDTRIKVWKNAQND